MGLRDDVEERLIRADVDQETARGVRTSHGGAAAVGPVRVVTSFEPKSRIAQVDHLVTALDGKA